MPIATVEDVRRAYAHAKGQSELRGDWPAYVIFRPVSFWLTPWLLKCRVSAMMLTVLCGLLALALPLAARWPSRYNAWCVFSLGLCVQLLDCIDGNVARLRAQISRRGAYLDMLTGEVYWLTLLCSLGQLAQQTMLGLSLGALIVLNRLCREHAAHLSDSAPLQTTTEPRTAWGRTVWARVLLSGLDQLIIFGIGMGAALGIMPQIFWATALYVVAFFVAVQIELWRGLR